MNLIESHYSGGGDLVEKLKSTLLAANKDLDKLTTAELATFDEFHIRGRQATLELAELMRLKAESKVLDVGSGLGGPARTVAEEYGCHVTGIDLTKNFCDAATAISQWVGLSDKVRFVHGDATKLPFPGGSFDAAMTIHVAMNIAAKDEVYAEVKRVLKPGGTFAIFDVVQGEGGEVIYPMPWAREASMSHLATGEQMRELLAESGFKIEQEIDSTDRSEAWFKDTMQKAQAPPPLSFRLFLEDFPQMAENIMRNLKERRIRSITYLCRS